MPRTRRLVLGALAAIAIAVVGIVATGGGSSTSRLDVQLTTANGLRNGTLVKMGGAEVGKIDKLHIDDADHVVAELELDDDKAKPVTEGASARVVTSNLLGSKYIDLVNGRRGGARVRSIATERVAYPVDLDQVLDVLDMDTRTRLQVLINEAGLAFTGRAADFNRVLGHLPRDFAAAQRLIEQLVSDNRSLGRAVAHSSRFVSRMSQEHTELGLLVDNARTTIATVAEHRQALRGTLARAPRTLTTAQRFFAELGDTVAPLRPAARAITATAPPLSAALAELPAFRAAAKPALHEASDVAPLLTRLGTETTPIVKRAIPVLRQAAKFSQTAIPLTRTLGVSVDDVFGLVEGWARSIQDADSLGHIFRGKAVISAEALRTILDQDLVSTRPRRRATSPKRGKAEPGAQVPSQAKPRPVPDVRLPAIRLPEVKLPGLPPIELPAVGRRQSGENQGAEVGKLLDFLMGS